MTAGWWVAMAAAALGFYLIAVTLAKVRALSAQIAVLTLVCHQINDNQIALHDELHEVDATLKDKPDV